MIQLGIRTGSDLKKIPRGDLIKLFGKLGDYYYNIAHGQDDRPVEPDYIRKSIGKEITLERDIDDLDRMEEILKSLADRVARSLENHESMGRTITLKVKYADFTCVSRSITIDEPCDNRDSILMHARNLLSKTEAGIKKVRLLGISISNLDTDESELNEKQLIIPFSR
jgi:DNA polymerase-4